MAKISLKDIFSGFNLSRINENFETITDTINNKVLFRDNPEGEPNQMLVPLDMNGKRIYNLPPPENENDAARLKDIQSLVVGLAPASLIPFSPTTDVPQNTVQGAIAGILPRLATAAGSTLVGYKAPYTGSVLRTVSQKLGDIVNAADFGAKGDGVTDDTAALQAAANAVGYGGTINLNAGVFFVTSTIILRGATKLIGKGIGSTVVYRTGDYGDTFVCGTINNQNEPARSCEFRKIEFRHSVSYIPNSTTIPNKATQGAHLHIYGAQEAIISDCWFTRLPYGVIFEGGSWVKVNNCQFSGVWDNTNPALQEGRAQLYAKYNTIHGNPTTWVVKNCNFLGATFMRDVIYSPTTEQRVVNRVDTIGSIFGFLIDGGEDIVCNDSYFGGHYAAELAMITAAGGSIIDVRIAKNFFDGISQGAGVLIAPEVANRIALAVTIEGNVFTDNYRGVQVNKNIGSNTPSCYHLSVRGNHFLSGIGTQVIIGGARGFTVSDNVITDYNKHNVTNADPAFMAGVLVNDIASSGVITDNTIGGGGNGLQNNTAVNFCYAGVVSALPDVAVSNNNYIGIRDGSVFRVGKASEENQRVITTGNYPAVSSDAFIIVNKPVNEATVVVLPVNPPIGKEIVIKDVKGNAATFQIIVSTSDGTTIDGQASRNIATNYGSMSLRFIGSTWVVK